MYENAYEALKELIRGKKISLQKIRVFIKTVEIDKEDKKRLLNLTPENYIGLASYLGKKIHQK